MPAYTFTWMPDLGATQAIKPTVEVAKYGEGYEQRVGTSVNPIMKKWSLKFTRDAVGIVAILDFLKARGGHESFDWEDPIMEVGAYVCREWKSSQVKPGVYEVSCDFEQVPD